MKPRIVLARVPALYSEIDTEYTYTVPSTKEGRYYITVGLQTQLPAKIKKAIVEYDTSLDGLTRVTYILVDHKYYPVSIQFIRRNGMPTDIQIYKTGVTNVLREISGMQYSTEFLRSAICMYAISDITTELEERDALYLECVSKRTVANDDFDEVHLSNLITAVFDAYDNDVTLSSILDELNEHYSSICDGSVATPIVDDIVDNFDLDTFVYDAVAQLEAELVASKNKLYPKGTVLDELWNNQTYFTDPRTRSIEKLQVLSGSELRNNTGPDVRIMNMAAEYYAEIKDTDSTYIQAIDTIDNKLFKALLAFGDTPYTQYSFKYILSNRNTVLEMHQIDGYTHFVDMYALKQQYASMTDEFIKQMSLSEEYDFPEKSDLNYITVYRMVDDTIHFEVHTRASVRYIYVVDLTLMYLCAQNLVFKNEDENVK